MEPISCNFCGAPEGLASGGALRESGLRHYCVGARGCINRVPVGNTLKVAPENFRLLGLADQAHLEELQDFYRKSLLLEKAR